MTSTRVSGEEIAVVFDAYAWVEYALDSPKAALVGDLLDRASEAYTPASVVAELIDSMLRHGIAHETVDRILNFIRSRTVVVPIDSEIADRAGNLNFVKKKTVKDWGMLDSLVYATATDRGSILTGDPHFKDIPGVIYIGK